MMWEGRVTKSWKNKRIVGKGVTRTGQRDGGKEKIGVEKAGDKNPRTFFVVTPRVVGGEKTGRDESARGRTTRTAGCIFYASHP